MITLQEPTGQAISDYLVSLADAPFNYDAIGCVKRGTPSGFVRDESVLRLGSGEAAFESACDGIRSWTNFPKTMVSMVRLSDAIEVGTTVAVVCYAAGVWTANPARILATHDEVCGDVRKFGFTYGTLAGHVERGEERFCIEWDLASDQVTYRIIAVSRPSHPFCWIAYPYARRMQAKFRQLSGEAMQAFVADRVPATELKETTRLVEV
ncbi:MAG: DUF1990 family protein [Planctomycetaceae bacterium]